MSGKLLTIAIPTCNRAVNLKLLLDVLSVEIEGLESLIDVVIFDNASEDSTPEVLAGFVARCSVARFHRHAINIGSAPNFLACYSASNSSYFWMFGDDDAPAKGLLAKVVKLLLADAPDLVYVDSRWSADIASLVDNSGLEILRTRMLTRQEFCQRTNVYLTFISSIIVNKNCMIDRFDPVAAAAGMGMYFVQLCWTLGAVKHGERFAVIEGAGVLATKGNSGGYGPMTVFGVEFPKAVRELLGDSPEALTILRRTVVCYLPGLFWNARNGTGGMFNSETPWKQLQNRLGGFLWYWTVIVPIGRFYRPLALTAFALARVTSYLVRRWDRRLTT